MDAEYLPLSKDEPNKASDNLGDADTDAASKRTRKGQLSWKYLRSFLVTFAILQVITISILGFQGMVQKVPSQRSLPTPYRQ